MRSYGSQKQENEKKEKEGKERGVVLMTAFNE